ncbi:HTH-type transcriptional regulator MhqR [Pseudoclavibacter triregionum]|nr:HTH-type transcriptional regulator MhqR [Pseudoclavibacter triregionum]
MPSAAGASSTPEQRASEEAHERRDDAAPRWLDERELAAWERFVAVLELLPAAIDAQLRVDADLTHFEYYVLHMLSTASDRRLQLKALASRTNATLARLSRVVSALERRGLVEREPAPHDARATNAHLTDAGFALLEATAPKHVAHVRETVVDVLTPQELDRLAELSDRILERIDPDRRAFHRPGHEDATTASADAAPAEPEEDGATRRLPKLSAPAIRALAKLGIRSLDDAAGRSRRELGSQHGLGPAGIASLDAALRAAGLPPLRAR